MAKIRVKFNDDHVKLIKAMRPQAFNDTKFGVDTMDMYGGTFVFEDMARILGLMDHAIDGTEENPMGVQFDKDTAMYLNELDEFIVGNMEYIMEILHQFADEGIKTGVTYTCKDYQRIWSKED